MERVFSFSDLKAELARRSWNPGAIEGSLVSADAAPVKALLVVSGLAGEGRTTTAAGIGLALSALGRTLLIDAHPAKQGLSRMFGRSSAPGLCDVLMGRLAPVEAVSWTESEDLYLMPAGSASKSARAMFRGGALPHLVDTLRRDWDHIVCDPPPLLTDADAALMARHFDGVVLVLATGRTRWETAKAAADRVQAAQGRLIGTVLNKYRSSRSDTPPLAS